MDGFGDDLLFSWLQRSRLRGQTIAFGALAGTAAAATNTSSYAVSQAGSAAPLTLATALASRSGAVRGVEVAGQVVTPDAGYYVLRIESWDKSPLFN